MNMVRHRLILLACALGLKVGSPSVKGWALGGASFAAALRPRCVLSSKQPSGPLECRVGRRLLSHTQVTASQYRPFRSLRRSALCINRG